MIRRFLIAIQFLTRLPMPRSLVASEEEISQAAAFFPLVGIVVGGGGALFYALLRPFLPATTCVLLVLIYSVLITNGFHEDGLADSLDGFGGGWTRQDMLTIMRDSRIGTFGTLGLVFLVLAKYNLLSMLERPQVWRWLIVAHTASRWTVLPLCLWLPYAREQGQGQLVARRIGWSAMAIATFTLIAVLLLLPWSAAFVTLAMIAAVVVISGLYYRSRLSGITGDCLGATNQLTEVVLYFMAVILSRMGTRG
ncbi:MAG: adenosylcobinamide-GDP ribazoletransferase [Candidatus Latescibacteria bacterium]|nr:adenosylcobinamide-GDP ribazoletransferase [Candidatus Latescibacterota bacterium]